MEWEMPCERMSTFLAGEIKRGLITRWAEITLK
jgi:hypothetical protein